MRSPRHRYGFTLLEILVALSIMVIVLGAAYGTFSAATKSASRCRARMALEEDGQGVLRMMAREIRCAYFPCPDTQPSGSAAPTTAPADAPDSSTPSERPVPRYLHGTSGSGSGTLQLLTTGGIADPDHPSSGLYNVSYRLDAAKKILFRRQADLLQPAQSDSDRAGWLCVARGVESLALSFSDGTKWSDDWKIEDTSAPPTAVKIEIVLSDPDGNQRAFSTTVFVPIQTAQATQTLIQSAGHK